MLETILNFLFGCSHQHYTFPITPRRNAGLTTNPAASRLGTYVACLDCGKELAYDWAQMRIAGPARRQSGPLTAAHADSRGK